MSSLVNDITNTGSCKNFNPKSLLTLQDFSPLAANHPFLCWLRALQPPAAKPATNTKLLRTAEGSEESRRKET